MKYIKNPIIVEAFQMTEEMEGAFDKWPPWLNKAWQKNIQQKGSLFYDLYEKYYMIHTLEGNMTVVWGDYIIKGIEGEIYICKKGIFKRTYTKIE